MNFFERGFFVLMVFVSMVLSSYYYEYDPVKIVLSRDFIAVVAILCITITCLYFLNIFSGGLDFNVSGFFFFFMTASTLFVGVALSACAICFKDKIELIQTVFMGVTLIFYSMSKILSLKFKF
jgi:hypothetical protein